MPLFTKVLVANRGEIAIRIFRTLHELGIAAVAVYSEADRDALHVRRADEAVLLGPGPPAESYLHIERVLEAASRTGARAVHPGYGFLAENAAFARACGDAGLTWIGPPPEAMEAMGAKIEARRRMAEAGVPIVPGTTERVTDAVRIVELGEEYGWPVAVKASAGGGGRGLRVVTRPEEAARQLEAAQREGQAWFADPAVYVEKYLEDPRHVEVQVLADSHGSVIHLGERDCTLQRRHQKVVEEAPSPAVDAALRKRLGAMAVAAARAVGYVSAGTVECLLDGEGNPYFLEMNTRIQVEHTITELVTGVDLVRAQVEIAAGQPLALAQDDVTVKGHAFECRLNAEDPAAGFVPAPGTITVWREPAGPGVRVDAGVEEGSEVAGLYDPLVAKLCVWDADREHARRRMLRALDELRVEGVPTLAPLHRAIFSDPSFAAGEAGAGLVERLAAGLAAGQGTDGAAPAAAVPPEERRYTAEVDGRRYDVVILVPGDGALAAERARRAARVARGGGTRPGSDVVQSPMQGTVLRVEVEEGEHVANGQVLLIVEAMKMENEITAHRDGTVRGLAVTVGAAVRAGDVLCAVEEG